MIAHIQMDPKRIQTVEEHLKEVGQIAGKLGEPLRMGNLAYLAGVFHDLGKWRKRFSDYLEKAVENPGSVRRGEVNHSSAGAIYIYRRYYYGDEIRRLTAQLIATAILSHHGLMDCVSPEGVDCFHKRIEDLSSLDYDEVMENFYNSNLDESYLDHCFEAAVEEVGQIRSKIEQKHLSPSFTIGMIERMLLSMVIDADRLDTAMFTGNRKQYVEVGCKEALWNELCNQLECYLKGFSKEDSISLIRKRVSEECFQFAKYSTGIYRLSVPTGGAKTLGSLRYALQHVVRPEHRKERIFYIGPFLSILEQNSQVFRNALGEGDFLLEHHSNVVIEDIEGEGTEEYNRYSLLAENWDAPMIVTTFVQFLNTLFSDSTQSVRRLYRLSNSVVIIDEIQSLPIQMIGMFNLAMNFLSTMCNTTVILCSATQPILEQLKPPIQLGNPDDIIRDKVKLYQELKRVCVEEKKGILTTEMLCKFMVKLLKEQDDILLILNTKAAAKAAFTVLEQYYKNAEESVHLYHLSTNMCGEHRLTVINEIKKNLKKKKLICVSTSLIEAGVDLSFNTVIRSFAGLDSIAQAAGRCNRHGEVEEGVVYLIHYKEEALGHLEQIQKGATCSKGIVELFQKNPEKYHHDLLSPEALEAFYQSYYYDSSQQRKMSYPVNQQGFSLLDLLARNQKGIMALKEDQRAQNRLMMYQAFKTAGKNFEVIARGTTGVVVPYGQGKTIIKELLDVSRDGDIKGMLRRTQRFSVNLYARQIERLGNMGAIHFVEDIGVWVMAEGFYHENLGIIYDGVFEYLEV